MVSIRYEKEIAETNRGAPVRPVTRVIIRHYIHRGMPGHRGFGQAL